MAIVTFDHYKYTPEQALGTDLVNRATDIHHNGDLTITIEGVTQAEADEALATHLVASAKARKLDEVHAWRDSEERKGFIHAGHRWDSDEAATKRILSVAPLCLQGIDPPTGYWTSADNVNVPMNAAEFVAMYIAMISAGGAVHDHQRAIKAEVDALSDVVAVENYTIGWGQQ